MTCSSREPLRPMKLVRALYSCRHIARPHEKLRFECHPMVRIHGSAGSG
jgi:hypothetical protein